jgi:hypothetical protein
LPATLNDDGGAIIVEDETVVARCWVGPLWKRLGVGSESFKVIARTIPRP